MVDPPRFGPAGISLGFKNAKKMRDTVIKTFEEKKGNVNVYHATTAAYDSFFYINSLAL